MPRLKTKAQLEQERIEAAKYALGTVVLDTTRLLLIYARQSSSKQYVSNIYSAMEQRDGLLERASVLGWTRDEQWVLYVENQLAKKTQVSGSLRIDQRPGLQALTEVIESGKASAVLVVSVDRITRDEDMITPVQFANLCKKHHVLIITDDYIFDFNNPNKDDIGQFMREAIASKEYIRKQIRGKMLKNRDRKAKMGRVANGSAPVGLMLDETQNTLIPSPHAERVNWLYARFRALDANRAALLREIIDMAKRGEPLFPDADGLDPKSMHLNRIPNDKGWAIFSVRGLKYILTNPAYLGHFVWNGHIIKRNAFPAIVDEDLWQYAFDHLADVDLDGNPIEREKRAVRYTQKKSIDSGALLTGVRENGKLVIDGVNGAHVYYTNAKRAYLLSQQNKTAVYSAETTVKVRVLDAIVETRLLHWLGVAKKQGSDWITMTSQIIEPQPMDEQTADFFRRAYEEAGVAEVEGEWQEPKVRLLKVSSVRQGEHTPATAMNAIPDPTGAQPTGQSGIQHDLALTNQELARVERRLRTSEDLMDDNELRETYAKKARLIKRRAELEQAIEQSERLAREREQARRDIETVGERWHAWPIERKRAFLRSVTESITLDELAPGWLRLTVVWSPLMGFVEPLESSTRAVDTAYIWRVSGEQWSENEEVTIRKYYPKSPRLELLQMLPNRSWIAILAKAASMSLVRPIKTREHLRIPEDRSLSDFQVLKEYGLEPGKRVQWVLDFIYPEVTNDVTPI